jgi:hypothetical protein
VVVLWGLSVDTHALGMSCGKEICVEERRGRGPGDCEGRRGKVDEELFVGVVLWDLCVQGGHRCLDNAMMMAKRSCFRARPDSKRD